MLVSKLMLINPVHYISVCIIRIKGYKFWSHMYVFVCAHMNMSVPTDLDFIHSTRNIYYNKIICSFRHTTTAASRFAFAYNIYGIQYLVS